MKNAVRGLIALALGLALSVFAFGQFSAMEQGPPGLKFHDTLLTKTFPAEPTTNLLVSAIVGGAFGIAITGAGLVLRLRRSVRVLDQLFMEIPQKLVRKLSAAVRKLVPVSHFVTSRPV